MVAKLLSRGLRRVAGPLVRGPIVEVRFRLRTATSFWAARVTASPCFTGWVGRPGVHTRWTNCFE